MKENKKVKENGQTIMDFFYPKKDRAKNKSKIKICFEEGKCIIFFFKASLSSFFFYILLEN